MKWEKGSGLIKVTFWKCHLLGPFSIVLFLLRMFYFDLNYLSRLFIISLFETSVKNLSSRNFKEYFEKNNNLLSVFIEKRFIGPLQSHFFWKMSRVTAYFFENESSSKVLFENLILLWITLQVHLFFFNPELEYRRFNIFYHNVQKWPSIVEFVIWVDSPIIHYVKEFVHGDEIETTHYLIIFE